MSRPKHERNELKYKYSKLEVVWAKIAGYPWWPATITCTPSKSNSFYKVDFIGDRSYAFLSDSKIAKYVEFRHQYQSNKKSNKNFINAIAIAARKYQQAMAKQGCAMKSKGSVEYKTSQQKQQLNKQFVMCQISEKIQQFSINQQQLRNSKLESKQQIQIEPQMALQQDKIKQAQYPQSFQHVQQESLQNDMQAQVELQAQHIRISGQQRQLKMEALLKKYRLDNIPLFKKHEGQKQLNDKKKQHWKRKLISKNKKQTSQQFGQKEMIIRKIFTFLIHKVHVQDARKVAYSLGQQVYNDHHKIECFRKAIQWINMTAADNIINFHFQWVNFFRDGDREREKLSSATMEYDSQDHLVK